MKKFYVLMAALLIASVSFAQISTTKKVVKTDGQTIVIKGKPATANQPKAVNSYWFNLIDDAITYYGLEDPDGFAPPIQCDTLGLYPFSDGNSPVQFCSVGQVYDWSNHWWNDLYDFTGASSNIPHMPSGNSYSVDSIQMIFNYTRGTNVAATVVDTVAISYIIGLNPDEDISTLSTQSAGPVFIMPVLPYNQNTFMASTTCATTSGLTNTLGSSTIVYDKVPLTIEDTTGGSFYYLTLPAPAELANLTQKQIAVAVTFIPGGDRTPTSVIGTDLDAFRTYMLGDPRDGYGDWGSPELLEDYEIGLFTDVDNYTPGAYFYNVYQPTLFYTINPKPWISLRVTCNDCGVVNVPEIEKNNLTVYPNPATNKFTVDLGNDEKANIQLFNLVGQQVYSETITGSAQVNVSNLHSGVYMLKVNQNGKVTTTKVVVK